MPISHSRLAMFSSVLAVAGNLLLTSASHAAENNILIPERTEVKLSLLTDMRSGAAKENAEVPFEVEKDVKDDKGNLLIKAGTPAFGKVLKSKRHGAFGAPGKLDFTCDYIQLQSGAKINLRESSLAAYGRDNRTATVAGTAILIAPIALFIHGRDVTVKKGTEYIMYVDKSASVVPDTTPSPAPVAPAPVAPAPVAPAPVAPAPVAPAPVAPAPVATAPSPSPAPAPPTEASTPQKNVYLTKDGKAYVGTLENFDGTNYTIKTEKGIVKLYIMSIQKITPVQ